MAMSFATEAVIGSFYPYDHLFCGCILSYTARNCSRKKKKKKKKSRKSAHTSFQPNARRWLEDVWGLTLYKADLRSEPSQEHLQPETRDVWPLTVAIDPKAKHHQGEGRRKSIEKPTIAVSEIKGQEEPWRE